MMKADEWDEQETTLSQKFAALEDVVVDATSIDEAERVRLTTMAKRMTEALLEATDLLGGVPWCLVHEKHGISLFRADVSAEVPCNVHAVCKFACDIEDVAESMITNTTESYKRMMSMLSSDFIDGAVIQNVVEPNELNPHRYVALKWAAFKSSSPFTKDRDFTILEYVDMIEDDQGQKIAFRIMESVEVANNSPYAESSKYTRDIVPLIGFMYHTTKKSGELRMTYTCNFDKNGDLPAWAANSAIQSHVEKCINGILKYIETFRAKKEAIDLPQQVIPMNEQDCCYICQRNFCVMRRKYNCLKCGEVICSSHSSMRKAKVPDVGDRLLRVCTVCVLEARRSSRNGVDSPASTCSNGSTSSFFGTNSKQAGGVKLPLPSQPIMRSQSFAQSQRRSYDEVLEPVRNRLIEYKTFSDGPESLPLPKASFPPRSFSDGLIMRKGALFGNKRRGSPADLAISLEAFKMHQMRAAGDLQSNEMSRNDKDDLAQLEAHASFPSPSSRTDSPSISPPRLRPRSTKASNMDRNGRAKHNAARKAVTVEPAEDDEKCATSQREAKARLNAAIERSQGIIEAAQHANNLAQHARKLSHHRIVAMKREALGMPGNSQHMKQRLEYRGRQGNNDGH